MQGCLAIAVQILCIRMLAFQHSISHSIIHFVALETILELPMMYYEMLVHDPLKEIMEHHNMPTVDRRGKDINFCERPCFHKFARVVYRFFRVFYITIIYYFIPYSTIALQWFYPGGDPSTSEHH
jgi:hypothetical protein